MALQVLKGNTKGYKKHPQLARFRKQKDPVKTLACYLQCVFLEAQRRGYHFNHGKIHASGKCRAIAVTDAQLRYEIKHLQHKLRTRDPSRYKEIERVRNPRPHPLLKKVRGQVEEWEKGVAL